MAVRLLNLFHFSEDTTNFFVPLIQKLTQSPLLESNKIELSDDLAASIESSNNWQEKLKHYGVYSFGRLPQDNSPKPDIALPVADPRVSRRTGWLVYLPIEGISGFIKHKNNNNTVYVNEHPCNFSLLQNLSVFSFPKDKTHQITFFSEDSNCYLYEETPYLFSSPGENHYIHAEPQEKEELLYNLVGSLGSGTSGKTYIAFDNSGDHLVTIKKFFEDLNHFEGKNALLDELFHNYRLLQIERQTFLYPRNEDIANQDFSSLEETASIGHLNLSQIIRMHILEHQGQTFLCRVNEYNPGFSLAKYMELIRNNQKFIAVHIFKNIAYQILVAIKYLHLRGITHCNLNPHKILLVPYPFGTLVKIRDYPLNENPFLISEATHQKQKKEGQFHFIAPELSDLEQITPQADTFSFAMICCYMLTNSTLFSDVQSFEELHSHYQHFALGAKLKEKLLKAGINEEFSEALIQCFTVDPQQRTSLQSLFEKLLTIQE
ncbi:protein kinase domain-containing protein [Candidatus Uabimicrobium amorphum]|uniref:Serine/threonine protein kinase n=1 Tax=Uabimicrobium amorphum TaxID=2596890 RepID=A0A5S9IIV0_UABAM|nr:protein kinase [Candidatus Uabimicrobium amorphum]BBM82494.1 serine/threonine protein kinase [Candidatus Uabimicrobium amorphum]